MLIETLKAAVIHGLDFILNSRLGSCMLLWGDQDQD